MQTQRKQSPSFYIENMYQTLHLLILFLFTLSGSGLMAQHRTISCLHLKTGTIYRGSILKTDKDSTTILTLGENKLRFANADIDSVSLSSKREQIRIYKSALITEKGWFTLAELSTRPAFFDELSIGASAYRGFKFNPNTSLAGGIGFNYKPSHGLDYYNFYKIALQGRYDFKSKGDFPFLLLEGGLQRIFSDKRLVRPLYYQAGIGYCFRTRGGKAIFLSAGITQNMLRYKYYEPSFNFFPKNAGTPYYSDWFYHYEAFLKLSIRIKK